MMTMQKDTETQPIQSPVRTRWNTLGQWILDVLLPLLIGFLVFGTMFRMGIMRPSELQWLGKGDAAQHLIGLQYFVQEQWQLPPGKLTAYGDGVVTSVVYTDSVPLIAIPWKAVIRQLGITRILQPYGLFIALGFCLQGYFGYHILRRLTGQRWLSLIGTFLLLLSPSMFFRLPGHLGLGAHWIILYAFLLLLRPGELGWKKNSAWLILLGIALGVHFYLFCMAIALYGVELLGGLWRRQVSLVRMAVYVAAFIGLVAICGWIFGYFIPVDSTGDGYGEYKFNVLGFFNPMEGWSTLFPSFRWARDGEYEGFAWIGTGLVLLWMIISAAGVAVGRDEDSLKNWRSPILCGILTLLLAAAMTPYVNAGHLAHTPSLILTGCVGVVLVAWASRRQTGLGFAAVLRELFSNPITALATMLVLGVFVAVTLLPFIPCKLLEITRASGRMSWPVLYWLGCWIIFRVGQSFSKPVACLLVAACVVIQAADMSPKMKLKRHNDFPKGGLSLASCSLPSATIRDALWRYCEGKQHLWIVMRDRAPEEGDQLGLLAIQKGVLINRAWVARFLEKAEKKRQAEITGILERGSIPDGVVYYVRPESRMLAGMAIERAPGEVEFVEDKGIVVLTRAAHPSKELAEANLKKWRTTLPCFPIEAGKPILFTKENNSLRNWPGAAYGISDAGDEGTWTEGSLACINLKAPQSGSDLRLAISLLPFINPRSNPGQYVKVLANGEPLAEWSFIKGGMERKELIVPGRLIAEDRVVLLRFEIAYPISPKVLKQSRDPRMLGICLYRIDTF